MELRLKYELSRIQKQGLFEYFSNQILITNTCDRLNILTSPGRGNSCSSCYLYKSRVNKFDPTKYNLIFEKFLYSDYQCIDIDVPVGKRNYLIEEIRETLPSDKVLYEVLYHCKYAHIDKPEVILYNSILYQIHPTAIIIINNEYDLGLDTCHIYNKQYIIVEELKELSKLGNVRHNLISNGFLNSLEYLTSETGVDLEKIDLEDRNVISLFESGKVKDIFQFNSEEIINALKAATLDDFMSLVDIKSLCVNGGSSLLTAYIHRNIELPKCEELDLILAKTHGALIYSEAVIEIFYKVLKFDLEKSCKMEKEIRKHNSIYKDQIKQEMQNRFKEVSDLNFREIDEICNYILYWGKLSMPKSHMISYTIVSFWFAYFKLYYRNCFNRIGYCY